METDTFEDYDTNADWVFNFESDHLALRGNREYSSILRTIALLNAQKIQIHNDIEKIVKNKNKYLHDPSGFVNDIFEDKFVSPEYRCIAEIQEFGSIKTENFNEEDMEAKLMKDIKVRGRVFDQTKPETFNQLWTCEEQRRLEQLLIEYPVEPVEMRRFAKIAHALGNRTAQQVASRVQKFFKKLHSVGMPVPGRIPKNKKSVFPRAKHFYKNLYRRSTFFPAHDVPVNMPDDEMMSEEPYGNNSLYYNKNSVTTTALEKENMLNILQEIRKEKASQSMSAGEEFKYQNQCEKCENCLESVYLESRWICNSCCCYINLCGDCMVHQLMSKTFLHISHELMLHKESM